MTRFVMAVVVVSLTVTAAIRAAQAPATPAAQEPLPAFDVASIRVNKTAQMNRMFRPQPGGRFEATNLRLRDLIQFAYQVRNFQIEGGPDWIDTINFDIVAKAPGDVPPPMPGGPPSPYMLMLRTLLAERFKLVVRQETKELPIYALSIARADGRLGPDMSVSTTDCETMMKAAMKGGAPPLPPIQDDRITCGLRIGLGRLDMGGFGVAELANALGVLLQRTVVNRTGLTGFYDAKMTFAPEQLPGAPPMPPPGTPGGPPIDPNAPSIFTALQEQLGLKLDSARGPVQVLVIDRAEMPVED
jgi:uncharacterized protein (TIGR03435 family)